MVWMSSHILYQALPQNPCQIHYHNQAALCVNLMVTYLQIWCPNSPLKRSYLVCVTLSLGDKLSYIRKRFIGYMLKHWESLCRKNTTYALVCWDDQFSATRKTFFYVVYHWTNFMLIFHPSFVTKNVRCLIYGRWQHNPITNIQARSSDPQHTCTS